MNQKPEILPDTECNAVPPPDTETIDRLFLELSQFSKATTRREIELTSQVEALKFKLACAKPKSGVSESSFTRGYEQGKRDAESNDAQIIELKGRISLQKETIETIEKDRAELKDKCENLKSELRLVRGMATPLKQEKVFCVGQPIIEILAAKGEWNSDSGGGLIAASDLFGNDPYSKISALECEVERHKRDAKLQYEEATRQAKRADDNWERCKLVNEEVMKLKQDNRYQRGFGDGYKSAVDRAAEAIKSIPDHGE